MEVSQQIIQVLDDLSKRFGIAIDWTQDNVIPYIETLSEKYIKYEIATSIFYLTIGLGMLILCALIARTLLVNKYNVECLAVVFFVAIVCIFAISVQVIDVITCCTFPEKMIFEYLKAMLK